MRINIRPENPRSLIIMCKSINYLRALDRSMVHDVVQFWHTSAGQSIPYELCADIRSNWMLLLQVYTLTRRASSCSAASSAPTSEATGCRCGFCLRWWMMALNKTRLQTNGLLYCDASYFVFSSAFFRLSLFLSLRTFVRLSVCAYFCRCTCSKTKTLL